MSHCATPSPGVPVMWMILRIAGVLSLFLLLLACASHVANSGRAPLPARPSDTVRVASHNVHYIVLGRAEGPWSVGDWERRRGAMDAAFKALDADLVAFQEMESFQRGDEGSVNLARDWLLAQNPGYAAAASGDARVFPSTQPILYRTDRLRLVDQGWFFFSDTPDVIYSRTFNGSFPAFASWATFAPPGGEAFTVVNVHFDYGSRSNRLKSAALVAERFRPRIAAGERVVLVGDLNALYGSETMGLLEGAGLAFARVPGATFHFNRGINLYGAIDHLGVGPGVAVTGGPAVLRQQFGGVWPSDHYPVVADIRVGS